LLPTAWPFDEDAAALSAVTAGAADASFAVLGALEVGMRGGVARETGGVDLPGGHFAELQDFGGVSTGLHMRLAWAMAAFAGDAFTAVLERELCVGIVAEPGGDIGVAEGAGFGTDEGGGNGGRGG
jgi:hypothetical protein